MTAKEKWEEKPNAEKKASECQRPGCNAIRNCKFAGEGDGSCSPPSPACSLTPVLEDSKGVGRRHIETSQQVMLGWGFRRAVIVEVLGSEGALSSTAGTLPSPDSGKQGTEAGRASGSTGCGFWADLLELRTLITPL